jgi:hypothetical protein
MLSKTKMSLAAALVLGAAVSASAATRSHGSNTHPPPTETSTGGKYGPYCTASGGPECNTGCQATGAPCRERPDSW